MSFVPKYLFSYRVGLQVHVQTVFGPSVPVLVRIPAPAPVPVPAPVPAPVPKPAPAPSVDEQWLNYSKRLNEAGTPLSTSLTMTGEKLGDTSPTLWNVSLIPEIICKAIIQNNGPYQWKHDGQQVYGGDSRRPEEKVCQTHHQIKWFSTELTRINNIKTVQIAELGSLKIALSLYDRLFNLKDEEGKPLSDPEIIRRATDRLLNLVRNYKPTHIFYACLFIALKCNEEPPLSNDSGSSVISIPLKKFNQLERDILVALNFSLGMRRAEFTVSEITLSNGLKSYDTAVRFEVPAPIEAPVAQAFSSKKNFRY